MLKCMGVIKEVLSINAKSHSLQLVSLRSFPSKHSFRNSFIHTVMQIQSTTKTMFFCKMQGHTVPFKLHTKNTFDQFMHSLGIEPMGLAFPQ